MGTETQHTAGEARMVKMTHTLDLNREWTQTRGCQSQILVGSTRYEFLWRESFHTLESCFSVRSCLVLGTGAWMLPVLVRLPPPWASGRPHGASWASAHARDDSGPARGPAGG